MNYKIYVKQLAARFRRERGYGQDEPIDTLRLLRKLKILTVFKPLHEALSGIAARIGDKDFILINSNHSIGRQNFTIAHEIYHLFYDESFSVNIVEIDNNHKPINEKKADCFASELLLPDAFIEMIPQNEQGKDSIRTETLVTIEQHFAVSRSALLIRLIELGIISKSYANSMRTDVKRFAYLLGYDTYLYCDGNHNRIVGNYPEIAKQLYDMEVISESHYISLLQDVGFKEQDIEQYL